MLAQSLHYWQRCTHRGLRQTERPLQYPMSRGQILCGKNIEPCLVTTDTRPGWAVIPLLVLVIQMNKENSSKKVNWLNCRFLCSLKLYTSYILNRKWSFSNLSKKTKTVTLVLFFSINSYLSHQHIKKLIPSPPVMNDSSVLYQAFIYFFLASCSVIYFVPPLLYQYHCTSFYMEAILY